jgi:putative PIN family toxin of toxin-antitoxin system
VGARTIVIHRVVFDTSTIVSALAFPKGRLAWLRPHWEQKRCIPLICAETASEFTRVLSYTKFHLEPSECLEMLAAYLPFCEVIEIRNISLVHCRDKKDQIFLDLAHSSKAHVLISGDQDLLVLAGQTKFAIESPEAYRLRINAQAKGRG